MANSPSASLLGTYLVIDLSTEYKAKLGYNLELVHIMTILAPNSEILAIWYCDICKRRRNEDRKRYNI